MTVTLVLVAITFLVAGFVKGVIGLGLPTISMGLLALAMPSPQAAAILVVPALVTNFWQMLDGPGMRIILRRLWPLFIGICVGTWAAAGMMSGRPRALARCRWAWRLQFTACSACRRSVGT